MSNLPKFTKFQHAARKAKNLPPITTRVLALDPGETTGYALLTSTPEEANILYSGQLPTWPEGSMVTNLTGLLRELSPHQIVYERYAVYEWKSQDHSWSEVPTIQIIGCLKTLCHQIDIPFTSQTAQVAKNYCTDSKLKSWDLWMKGERHARDAIRHGCYYLLFGTGDH